MLSVEAARNGWPRALALAGALVACAHPRPERETEPAGAAPSRVVVPTLWDQAELATWATPVAGLGVPPTYASEEEYYAAPVDNLRTYPLYHPSREPPGYREWLAAQIAFLLTL